MKPHKTRWEQLQERMSNERIDGMIISQNVDLYYLTGSMQTGFLFLPAEGEPLFFVRRSVSRALEESAASVVKLGSLKTFGKRLHEQFPQVFRKTARIGEAAGPTIATEYDVLPVQWWLRLQGALPPNVQWTDGSSLIRQQRMIKTPMEIASIRQAAYVINDALELALSRLHIGMTELELMAFIEEQLRRQGHLGLMRMRGYNQEIATGMLGAGANAAVPTYFDGPAGGRGLSPASPQSASRRPIGEREPILIDIGCCIDGYVIDQTRTVVIGSLPADLQSAYDISEAILLRMEAMLKPGALCEDFHLTALDMARNAGLEQHFMGYGEDQVKFIGHGIGLEVDELPVLAKGFKQKLEPGMVVAIEPKFTFPGKGVVGIENTYAITSAGYEKLTLSREGVIRVENRGS